MDNNLIYSLLILFLPLVSFVYQIFFGKILGRNTHFISISLIALIFGLSLSFLFQSINKGYGTILDISTIWFSSTDFNVSLGIYIDNITSIMLCVVSFISLLVHIYSTEYMKDDPRYSRYFGFLGIFTFSMNGIVLADSLIMMYIFWELVGLSSYLLIGFWFEKDSAANACKKAFLTNRVGDIGMFIGMMILFFSVGSFNINELIYGTKNMNLELLTIAGLLVFMGAIGKSAQFPLHIWLPDAMEGPTPVSALIHAATMVAAGVYMTFRIFPFLTPDALAIIAVIGAITALCAAIMAVTRNDIKAVLAYSTISQLGYMIMALGVGAHLYAFFHLVTHAMFKACLFLCSGSVIHAMHHSLHHLHDHDTDPQDMRNMGGLKNKMPITHLAMLISTLAIAGVPFFSGFLSKDGILAGVLSYYHMHHGWTLLLPLAGFGAAMITAFYMFRLIFMTFYGKPNKQEIYSHVHESPLLMTVPLILLSLLSTAFAFTLNFNPLLSKGWFKTLIGKSKNNFLDMQVIKEGIHHAHDQAMYLSLFVATLGILTSVIFYYFKKVDLAKVTRLVNMLGLYNLSKNKFYIDRIYSALLYKPFMRQTKIFTWIDWDVYDKIFINGWSWVTLSISKISAYTDYNWLDQKVIDGTAHLSSYISKKLKSTQSGVIQNYLLSGTIGLIIVFIIFQNL